MIKKIKHWLISKRKKRCHGFCPTCKFYNECVQDFKEYKEYY